jgi:glutathione peroxidase-family protein
MNHFATSSSTMWFLVLWLVATTTTTNAANTPDQHPKCQEWADIGECEKNPGYMKPNCATACGKITDAILAEKMEMESIASVFDLEAMDIDGNVIAMNQFRDQVTIITNVASYCGYTQSHYTGLVELYNQVRASEKINILAFPCNQFGEQEPGTKEEIKQFVQKYGVQFIMMDKINVNGPNASKLYKYLKYKTAVDMILWNFATYFVIAPDGTITQHSGVEPMALKGVALSLLKEEL